VRAEWRGRGIGGALLTALCDAARREGAPALSLSVELDNPARRLYERLGFEALREAAGATTMRRHLD
jgi:ribosomal protein S18 acetylase RimI-like enzyme